MVLDENLFFCTKKISEIANAISHNFINNFPKEEKVKVKDLIMFIGIGILILVAILGVLSPNGKTRYFGGKAGISVPCGMKLESITWKKGNLWLQYRKMRDKEKPENHFFKEVSTFRKMEGEVEITESKCDK